MTISSKGLKWIGIAAAVLLAAFFLFQRSCRNSQIDKLKGELEIVKAESAKEHAVYLETKAAADKVIKEQGTVIASQAEIISASAGASGKINAAITDRDKANAALEATRKTLTDKDAIIKNQDATIAGLHISLEFERADKAEIAKQRDAFKLSFNSQVEIDKQKDIIMASFKTDYDREVQRRTIAENLVDKQSHQITSLKLTGTVKTVALVGLAAFGGYELFIKKPAAVK
jgi:hypothetical protein